MKKLIGLILCLYSIVAYCEWTQVAINESETATLYMDIATKKKVGSYIRVWTLMDVRRPGEKFKSFKVLNDIDCLQDRTRTLQVTAYSNSMGGGSSQGTENGSAWSYVIPGTMEYSLFKRVCN